MRAWSLPFPWPHPSPHQKENQTSKLKGRIECTLRRSGVRQGLELDISNYIYGHFVRARQHFDQRYMYTQYTSLLKLAMIQLYIHIIHVHTAVYTMYVAGMAMYIHVSL